MTNETIAKKNQLWHNPAKESESGPRDEAYWRDMFEKGLSKVNCIVLLKSHEDYDLDLMREYVPNIVDAEEMLAAIDEQMLQAHQPISKPVELSAYEGNMDVVYTGVVPVVYKAQRTLLVSLIESVAWAFVLIAFVMACLLSPARTFFSAFLPRNLLQAISSGAISMIPNVFPVVVIFGLMGHLNIEVDIGSMMTASVAMGVAVDDTIHFLTWFRDGLRRGLDRREAIFVAYKHVAPAMTQTTLIGGLGLSVFALSTFTPTQRFGTLMLALLSAALVGDLIFLPALLASPLGRIFTVRPAKKGNPHQDDTSFDSSGELVEQSTVVEPSEYRLAADELDVSTPNVKPPHMMRRDNPHVRRRI